MNIFQNNKVIAFLMVVATSVAVADIPKEETPKFVEISQRIDAIGTTKKADLNDVKFLMEIIKTDDYYYHNAFASNIDRELVGFSPVVHQAMWKLSDVLVDPPGTYNSDDWRIFQATTGLDRKLWVDWWKSNPKNLALNEFVEVEHSATKSQLKAERERFETNQNIHFIISDVQGTLSAKGVNIDYICLVRSYLFGGKVTAFNDNLETWEVSPFEKDAVMTKPTTVGVKASDIPVKQKSKFSLFILFTVAISTIALVGFFRRRSIGRRK